MRQGELLVFDQPEPCPYLPGRVARMPLRRPLVPLTRTQLDQRLAEGDRRCGEYIYRTRCPGCKACEPLRIDVSLFVPSATQGRTWRRGNRELAAILGPPRTDDQHLELFNKHRRLRGLDLETGPLDPGSYAAFLEESCCETVEIRYFLRSELVAVAITDIGQISLSAVYCYFDPDYSRLSLGTYSILKQIDLCREWGKRFLYLGLYVADSEHMSYKSRFQPHERLIAGAWRRFESMSRGGPHVDPAP